MAITMGSGPYGRIRMLRTDIEHATMELRLINEGMRRHGPLGNRLSKKGQQLIIDNSRAEIAQILARQKKKKK